MPLPSAVLDACVLVPISLADALLRIAEKGVYQPLWSDRILAEAQRAIGRIDPGTDVTKRFAAMRGAFGDALVTGWEELEAGISLPDKNDRHVVAAAIQGGADVIVTANVADFRSTSLDLLACRSCTQTISSSTNSTSALQLSWRSSASRRPTPSDHRSPFTTWSLP